MTSRRAVAYSSPVSAIRLRAAALILSCDIVPLLRWPRPGAWPPHMGDHDGRGKTSREGWAALVLRHYHQRRAGVARIRQTWLPSARIRQPDRHFRRPAQTAGAATGLLLAGQGEPVADGDHNQVDAVVGGSVVVEVPDREHGGSIVARVDHAAVREGVVDHDQSARAYPRHDLPPVAEVAALVGVDEGQVEERLVGQRHERVHGRPEPQLYPIVQARLLPVLPGYRGPLLADVAAQQRSAGRESAGDANRGVTGEGPDLDRRGDPGELREQGHEGALFGSDLQARLVRVQLSGLVGQLPQDGVGRAAVRGEVRVEVEADLLGAPRHGITL